MSFYNYPPAVLLLGMVYMPWIGYKSTGLFVDFLFILRDLIFATVVPETKEFVAIYRWGTTDTIFALNFGEIEL